MLIGIDCVDYLDNKSLQDMHGLHTNDTINTIKLKFLGHFKIKIDCVQFIFSFFARVLFHDSSFSFRHFSFFRFFFGDMDHLFVLIFLI